MHLTTVSILAANLLLLPVRVLATCYYVDGTQITDSSFTACNPDADVSACCANDKGSRSDICLSSGLCYAQDGNYRGFIYSDGCTDKSGLSADCPHFCPDGTLLAPPPLPPPGPIPPSPGSGLRRSPTDNLFLSNHELGWWLEG